MSKRDVLDERIARQFAWRMDVPENWARADAPVAPEAPKKEAPAVDPAEIAERARVAEEGCAQLAEEIRKSWALTSMPHQAAATKRLLRLAGRLSFDIVRMDDYPLEALRFWRLVVRHHEPGKTRRDDLFHLSFMPVSDRLSELVDLLVEAAHLADSYIAFLLDQSIESEDIGRRHPELGVRLAEIVEHGKTWASRALAARWLSLGDFPAAIPALRRALREPHIRLRYYALYILLQLEGALLPEDILFLLEDAVIHPMPEAHGSVDERIYDYETTLLDALKKIQPPNGDKPLDLIARGGGEYISRQRGGLGEGWAMRALAVAYPQRAIKRIDRTLQMSAFGRTYDAVEAIGLLPDDLARPRLLDAAAHWENLVSERAKAIWFERFGGVCPFDPLTHVPKELLTEPPSERFFSCLTVFRGASDEARHAMVDALLAEAPEGETEPSELTSRQREALALLLFALRSRVTISRHPTHGRLSECDWALMLLRRFGSLAVSGLITIAEPGALAGVAHGWFDVLADVVRKGRVTVEQADRLREISRRTLASPSWDHASSPLIMLAVVKPSASDEARLWEIFTAPFEGTIPEDAEDSLTRSPMDASRWAAYPLAEMVGVPHFDMRLMEAADRALQNRNWAFLSAIFALAERSNRELLLDAAWRTVLAFDGSSLAEGVVFHAAQSLKAAGRLNTEWIVEHLKQPESPLFSVAAHIVARPVPPEVATLLWEQLGSSARSGATATDAAQALLWGELMAGDDPRLDAILATAPLDAKASLCTRFVDREIPFAKCRNAIAECLLSEDKEITRGLMDSLYYREPEGMRELFLELLPRVPEKDVKELMQHFLKAPNEAALYWVDASDDDEEEDDLEEEAEEDEDLDS